MKKASNILLLIGGILTLVSLGGLLIAGIVLVVLGSPALTPYLIEGINNGTVHTSFPGTPEEQVALIQTVLSTTGTCLLLYMIPVTVAGVFAFIARSKQRTGFYVAAIVLAAIFTYCAPVIVGSIFGLITESREGSKGDVK